MTPDRCEACAGTGRRTLRVERFIGSSDVETNCEACDGTGFDPSSIRITSLAPVHEKSLALPRSIPPPLRVGTTAWRAGAPSERLTHEFHLLLPCRPVHVGLIGAALLGVRIAGEGSETTEAPSFHESSIETTDGGIIRVDYDLEAPEGLRENLVVFVDFEVTLKAKGQVTILLIFETPGTPMSGSPT